MPFLRSWSIVVAFTAAFCTYAAPVRYQKQDVLIPMRDGARLHTTIYRPEGFPTKAPIILERTPYGCHPYGPLTRPYIRDDKWSAHGYIFVDQDVRGRFMSEGIFDELRPQLTAFSGPHDIDESTDTFDTIDWLVKNVPGNNGKVGMRGISYPGGYAALGALSGHPALAASSPQAPTTDWFRGDDVHHNGAFFLMDNFGFYPFFLPRGPKPTQEDKSLFRVDYKGDAYKFFLEEGTVKQITDKYFGDKHDYWTAVMNHPDYDEFWQSRAIQFKFRNVKVPCLMVGGWFDAEDMFGPLAIFRENEKGSPGSTNMICMGPWTHGQWSWSATGLGDHKWGADTAKFFQDEVEFPFFDSLLREGKAPKVAKATMFDTGAHKWEKLSDWPPKNVQAKSFFLGDSHQLVETTPADGLDDYLSDPANPVPYFGAPTARRANTYLIADQRFAMDRKDVLTYSGPVLTQDVQLAGPITADLYVQVDGTDADFIVKVIDQFPSDASGPLKDTQMLVRAEVMRARYRNSLSNPQPLRRNRTEKVTVPLNDVLHTFRKGHRMVVQVQSSWFPIVDRNPHQMVNIYQAKPEDFVSARIRLLRGKDTPSQIRVGQRT
jgi:putative CocE/NonD family hydrolase